MRMGTCIAYAHTDTHTHIYNYILIAVLLNSLCHICFPKRVWILRYCPKCGHADGMIRATWHQSGHERFVGGAQAKGILDSMDMIQIAHKNFLKFWCIPIANLAIRGLNLSALAQPYIPSGPLPVVIILESCQLNTKATQDTGTIRNQNGSTKNAMFICK